MSKLPISKAIGVWTVCFAMACAMRGQQIGPNAQRQIAALLTEKANRTPAQQKMSSHLVHAAKILRGQPVHPDFPAPPDALPAVRMDRNQRVEVDVFANVTPDLTAYVATLGGTVLNSFPELRSMRVRMPLLSVERLAERNEVRTIRIAGPGPRVNSRRRDGGNPLTADRTVKTRNVAAQLNRYFGRHPQEAPGLGKLFRSLGAAFFVTTDTTGDIAEQANIARSTYGVDGTGVKIGVISSGVDSLAAEKAAGRLPQNVTVIAGQAGTGDEGTAMLEIIYSLAPGATLYFGTGENGRAVMVSNIQALADAGCKIIVDDLTYGDEAVYQNDFLAQKVNAVAAAGVFYFSAAGNNGSRLKGNSGTWEGDFNYSGQLFEGGTFHAFGSSLTDTILSPAIPGYDLYTLNWSDALAASNTDYDLFILDSSLSTVLGASTNVQNGSQDPQEIIYDPDHLIGAGSQVVIINYLGITAVRALHLNVGGGQLSIFTNGNVFGHSATEGAFTIAAADVKNAALGIFTGGNSNPVESYSSDGPRRFYFNDDGSAITPGNYLISTQGGALINKPDLTAADDVPSGLAAFNPFRGTSAAAPHAAAIAALVLQAKPNISVAQMRAVLAGSALDIEGPGFDINSGAGIIMAPGAIAATSASCTITVSPGGESFPSGGGSGSISVAAAPGCPWAFSTNTPWVFPTGTSAGSGNGTITFEAAANLGPARAGSFAIADQVLTVQQDAATISGSAPVGSISQIVSAGTWAMTLNALNLGTTSAQVRMNFNDNDGNPMLLPLTFPQAPPAIGPLLASTIDRTLAPGAQVVMSSTGPDNAMTLQGWGQLIGTGNVSGFGIFSNPTLKWEAVVPLESRNAASYILAFDDSVGLGTGLAIANLSNIAANVPVIIRDDTGAQIGSQVIALPALGHTSFMLTDKYPITVSKRGTIEFDTPGFGTQSAAQISVLGLRANGPALTTLPVLANVDASGGSIAHTLFNGGFTNSFTLVNTGTTSATATLNFFANDGSALMVPLFLPQTGENLSVTSLSRVMRPNSSLLIQTVGDDSQPSTEGSAQLSAGGDVSGFGIFRWTQFQQEASVPLETRTAAAYILAFDNMGGNSTGLAIANIAASAATVTIKIRDDTGALLQTTSLNLAANGHMSFMLPDTYASAVNKRGTVEFDTPAGGRISVIGLRATATGTLTTIPVLAK